jgi:hypothetical protein
MQAQFNDAPHVLLELGHVEDQLRLNKIGTGLHLLSQAIGSKVKWVGEGIGRRAQEEAGLLPFYGITALKDLFVPHGLANLQKGDRVEIMDVLGLGMVAKGLVVAG